MFEVDDHELKPAEKQPVKEKTNYLKVRSVRLSDNDYEKILAIGESFGISFREIIREGIQSVCKHNI